MPYSEAHRVLIVDDEIDNLKILVSIFEKYHPDYEILQTSDPTKVFEIAKLKQPSLIISDWEMPKLDGLQLIELLKKDTETNDIPIIIATGVMHSSMDLNSALSSGAADFIKKPLDPMELIARSNSAIEVSLNLKRSISAKNAELAESALSLVKNQEFVSDIASSLKELEISINSKDVYLLKIVDRIKRIIESKQKDDSLERFNIAFYGLHDKFNKNLLKDFPNLTNGELKLCAFLRLGMNTKNIASVLYQTIDSVKVSRSRLRKKLGLNQNQNLTSFLSTY